MDITTKALRDKAHEAHRLLNEHLNDVGELQAKILTATQRKDALHKSLLAATPSAADPTPAATPAAEAAQLFQQLHPVIQRSGINDSLPGFPDETKVLVSSLCSRADAEAEACRVARMEAEAAEAEAATAAAAAAAPEAATTVAPAPAATPATPATAASNSTLPVFHARPPPLLEDAGPLPKSNWPDGGVGAVDLAPLRTHGCISDENYALLTGATNAELDAVFENLGMRMHRHSPY